MELGTTGERFVVLEAGYDYPYDPWARGGGTQSVEVEYVWVLTESGRRKLYEHQLAVTCKSTSNLV